MQYYLVIKKNEIVPFAITWMDLEGIMLSKMSGRKTILYVITYMGNLKNNTNIYNKTETDSQI